MKNRYLLKTIKQEKLLDKFKEYKKMTREEIEDYLAWGDTNEFSWGFAIYLLNNFDKAIEYIEEIFCLDIKDTHYEITNKEIEKLLKILKGGKNE